MSHWKCLNPSYPLPPKGLKSCFQIKNGYTVGSFIRHFKPKELFFFLSSLVIPPKRVSIHQFLYIPMCRESPLL